jgi:sulfite reductase alpha subunit-like flavoprotein
MTGVVSSRSVLTEAERTNAELGHENLGFLSEAMGVLPAAPPLQVLPPSHRAWDQVAADLPRLWRDVAVRRTLDDLPVLDAGPDALPEESVWRASALMSILAHSYVRSELRASPELLPPTIRTPWEQLTARLDRPRPFLAYNDLIIYNWRLRDPRRPDPYRVENMDLLFPTVDNEEERVFYLTQVEIAAQCAPAVGAVVRAQEAAVRGDADALVTELRALTERFRHITEVSFHKIDPNPYGATHVDQVVWANTGAPFAVPIEEGTAGPSGTSSMLFHIMDIFLGRKHFDSLLGEEIVHLRPWFPRHHQDFLRALEEVSVKRFVEESGDRGLQGVWETLFEAYAGEKGYLGVHRLKVYGFLEIAFKVGRTVTITGFEGAFKEKAHAEVDQELENTRVERYKDRPLHVHHARLTDRTAAGTGSGGPVHRVTLDVEGTGLDFRVGDRVGVLPEASEALVARTVTALHARGDELIPLTSPWQDAVRHRHGYSDPPTSLPLRDFLRFAQLRPLDRDVGKSLVDLTGSPSLGRVLHERTEDQIELWDAFAMVTADGYEVRRLVEADLWESEALSRVVPPERYRLYSVSSPSQVGADGLPTRLELTVGHLRYLSEPPAEGVERQGTASTFLTQDGDDRADEQHVSVQVVRPMRFTLPPDPATPIVMFAGGSGISPFRGFLLQRELQSASGENWLYFATRTRKELYYADELARLVSAEKLRLRVAFSREDVWARFDADAGTWMFDPGDRQRLPSVMEEDANAALLWDLMRSTADGGRGAYFYVCGQAGFASSVYQSLRRIVARFMVGTPDARDRAAAELLRRLFAERRYMQDVFTTFAAHGAPGVAGDGRYDASEIATRNHEDLGYWLVIHGAVYDLTEFQWLHPGGTTIIREFAGTDATREYRAVLHHLNPEVDALLAMYKIGLVRRLDFGTRWGIALTPRDDVTFVTLGDLYRAWVRFLYMLVEMDNALRNDFTYLDQLLTAADDGPDDLSALKVMLGSNTHQRFVKGYFAAAVGDELTHLYALTCGLCASPREDVTRLRSLIEQANETESGHLVRAFEARFAEAYRRVAGGDANPETRERLRVTFATLRENDHMFMLWMISAVREAVKVFEQHEAETLERGGGRLIEALHAVPKIVERSHARLAARLPRLEGAPAPTA